MDRRLAIAIVVFVAGIAIGAGALITSRRHGAANTADVASCGMPLGKTAASRLPAGTVLLPANDHAELTGKATCGYCTWNIGDDCNTMLWDREGKHVVAVLPNAQLAELQKLTGT
jgi:hypothetical protein